MWDKKEIYERYIIKDNKNPSYIYDISLDGCYKISDTTNNYDIVNEEELKNKITDFDGVVFVGSLFVLSRWYLFKDKFKRNITIFLQISDRKILIFKFYEDNLITLINRIIDSCTIKIPLTQKLLKKILLFRVHPHGIRYCPPIKEDIILKFLRIKRNIKPYNFYIIDISNNKIWKNKFVYHFSLKKRVEKDKNLIKNLSLYTGLFNIFTQFKERKNIKHVYDISAVLPNPVNNWSPIYVGKVDSKKNQAILKTIVEGIERYSAVTCGIKEKTNGLLVKILNPKTYLQNLRKKGIDLELFLSSQRKKENFPYSSITKETLFTKCKLLSINNNKEKDILIPASRVFLYFNDTKNKQAFPSFSSGLAAAFSFKSALKNAIKELIERHTIMLSWIFRIFPYHLDIPINYHTKSVKKSITLLKKSGIDVSFYLFISDLRIPVITCVIDSSKDRFPWLTFGAACELNLREAIKKSFYEALMVRKTLIDLKYKKVLKIPSESKIKTLLDHVSFYSTYSYRKRKYIEFIYYTPYKININEAEKGIKYRVDSLQLYLKLLKNVGIRYVIYKELDTTESEQLGIKPLRAIIPGLTNIHGDEKFPYLGANRVIKCAEKLNVDLNSHKFPPHPFG